MDAGGKGAVYLLACPHMTYPRMGLWVGRVSAWIPPHGKNVEGSEMGPSYR